MRYLFLIALLALADPAAAQTVVSWSFDSAADLPTRPQDIPDPEYGTVSIDSTVAAVGSASLRVHCAEEQWCSARYIIPGVDSLRGQAILLTAQIRTELPDGEARGNIIVQEFGGRFRGRTQLWDRAPEGITDWREYRLYVPIGDNTSNLRVLFGTTGGPAWYDDVTLEAVPWGPSERARAWIGRRFTLWTGSGLNWLRVLLTYALLPFGLLFAASRTRQPNLMPEVPLWIHRWLGMVLLAMVSSFLDWVINDWPSIPTQPGAHADRAFWSIIIGSLATAAWVRFRPRLDEAQLWRNTEVVIRTFLAAIFSGYAMAKFYENQLQPITNHVLNTRVGDMTPMGLLWNFFGYSRPYVWFIGLSQMFGALLLMYRRTYLVGAMILTAVLSNIVFVNFAYDIPVQFPSSVFLVMIGFLLLPEVPRLYALLVQRTEQVPPAVPYRYALRQPMGAVLATLLFAYIVSADYRYIIKGKEQWGSNSHDEPRSRTWLVVDRTPADTTDSDATAWDQLVVEDEWSSPFRDGERQSFMTADFVDSTRTFTFVWADSSDSYRGTWAVTGDTLLLEGVQFGDSVQVRLEPRRFQLKPER